jgi:hypothetical protein
MTELLCEQIKQTVFEFIKDLKNNVFINPIEQGELSLVEFWFKKLSNRAVADHVVAHILPHKSHIEKRNLKFFLTQKDQIFKGLPVDRINHYASIIISPVNQGGMCLEDKKQAWSYFDILLALGEDYKKNI